MKSVWASTYDDVHRDSETALSIIVENIGQWSASVTQW
jgi:hypothetical protein